MRYGRSGEERVVASAEAEADLGEGYQDHPWTAEELAAAPAADTPTAGPATAKASDLAASVHLLNAGNVVAMVNAATTPEQLDALLEAEAAHPKHDGGRKSVLAAIEDRRAVLANTPA